MHKNRLISAIGSGALTFGGGILTAGCASPLEPVNSVSLHTPRAEVVCIQPGVEEKISCIKKRIATLSSRGDLSMAEAVCENSTSSMMCALKVVRDYIPKVADAHAPWEKCAVPSNEGQSIDIICLIDSLSSIANINSHISKHMNQCRQNVLNCYESVNGQIPQ